MPDAMRLTRAAVHLGLSYSQILRLVLTRRLAGWQDPENRSWWVDSVDLERFITARTRQSEQAAARAAQGKPA
jgi:hypothetical protein